MMHPGFGVSAEAASAEGIDSRTRDTIRPDFVREGEEVGLFVSRSTYMCIHIIAFTIARETMPAGVLPNPDKVPSSQVAKDTSSW
jgi:hypothetical protein